MYRKLICLAIVVLMLGFGGISQADLFDPPIDNPSFEATDLSGAPGWVDYVENWIISSQGSAYLENGGWYPTPDGINTLKMWTPVSVWQQIGNWSPNIDYEISMFVGRSESASALQVELWAGGNPALLPNLTNESYGFGAIDSTVGATLIGGDTLAPTIAVGENEWMSLILNTATGFNPGDALWLRIESVGGSFTYLDNVLVVALVDPALAFNPNPASGATDVLRDVVLSWTPGEFADKHDVYFGTNLDNVSNASRTDPLDVLLIEGQDANNYDPGRLEFDQTYFWRIDEVNAPPDSSIFEGEIWSFMVESLAYPIPSESITATASSQEANQGPEKTIDGSGLDENDLHSTDPDTMWSSTGGEPGSAWIQYEFDKPYKLHEMLVWNYNGSTILTLYGLKEVTIEYSTDAANWTQLDNVPEFIQALGDKGYASDITVAFDGAAAKYVKITANSNHGSGEGFFNKYGLSEVRFMSIPVNAKKPNPDIGAADVAVDATLGWKPGREAVEHSVYLSTDQQAVIDGTVPATTVSQNSYSPSLDLGSSYYWRIDEVNNAETPTTWPGDTWNFSTQEYLVVDDFESYNDISEGQEGSNLVYITWEDGYANPATNGSTMGYITGASMETGNVYGGGQAAPLSYNNTGASSSEVTANTNDLPIGRNWSIGSPTALVFWIHGDPGNTGNDQLYVKVGNSKTTHDADISRPQWKPVVVDLTGINLNNVSSLSIGIERSGGAGGTGKVFIDEIRLYREVPPLASEEIWIEAESGTITAPMMTYNDPNASGGQYIMKDPAVAESFDNPPADGLAAYSFTVAGGTYKIAGRVISSGGSDSFWIRIPGATTQTANHSSGWVNWAGLVTEGAWGWEDVFSSTDDGETVLFTMAAGTYTLELKYRENESQLDALVIEKID